MTAMSVSCQVSSSMATNAAITVTVLPSTLETVLVSTLGDAADVVLQPGLDDAGLGAGEEARAPCAAGGRTAARAARP